MNWTECSPIFDPFSELLFRLDGEDPVPPDMDADMPDLIVVSVLDLVPASLVPWVLDAFALEVRVGFVELASLLECDPRDGEMFEARFIVPLLLCVPMCEDEDADCDDDELEKFDGDGALRLPLTDGVRGAGEWEGGKLVRLLAAEPIRDTVDDGLLLLMLELACTLE